MHTTQIALTSSLTYSSGSHGAQWLSFCRTFQMEVLKVLKSSKKVNTRSELEGSSALLCGTIAAIVAKDNNVTVTITVALLLLLLCVVKRSAG